jgi:type IV pilus assembly protein PilW
LSSTTLLWNFGQAVYGFEATNTTTWAPVLDAAIPASPTPSGGNDVLVLRAARPGSPVFRTNAAFAVGDDIPVDKDASVTNTTLGAPVPVVISDCRGAAVFVATSLTGAGATTGKILHGTGTTPANSSTSLPRSFDVDALVQPVQTVIYYIASCTAVGANCPAVTPPALWQIVGSNPPQELIQGVEGIQLVYGVDTDGDLLANSYQKANAIADWGTVVSVNIAVLSRSIDETGTAVDKQTYKLLGGTAGNGRDYGPFNDRRQRAIFTTTITLRNGTT